MGRSGPIRTLLVGRPDRRRSAGGWVLVPPYRGSPARSGSGWTAGGQPFPGHATESLLQSVRLIRIHALHLSPLNLQQPPPSRDDAEPHRSHTTTGARLFIVD